MQIELLGTDRLFIKVADRTLIIDGHTSAIYDLSKCRRHPELNECVCELNQLGDDNCSGKVYNLNA